MQYLSTLMAMQRDDAGVTAVEYGLIAAFIAMAIFGAVSALGTSLSSMFTSLAGHFGT